MHDIFLKLLRSNFRFGRMLCSQTNQMAKSGCFSGPGGVFRT
jgi:hypothetical protein